MLRGDEAILQRGVENEGRFGRSKGSREVSSKIEGARSAEAAPTGPFVPTRTQRALGGTTWTTADHSMVLGKGLPSSITL
jgi:hypothetical protein